MNYRCCFCEARVPITLKTPLLQSELDHCIQCAGLNYLYFEVGAEGDLTVEAYCWPLDYDDHPDDLEEQEIEWRIEQWEEEELERRIEQWEEDHMIEADRWKEAGHDHQGVGG